jgi:hypothetical protein
MIRLQKTAEKIVGFGDLPRGWHYGNGSAPSEEIIQKALKLNSELALSGFSKTNAFPGIEGEIQVTGYQGPLYLEFTIEPNGEVAFLYERDEKEIEYKEKLDLETAIEIIRHFRGLAWALSVSFIKSTTTPIREYSKASLSSHPVMVVESQPLMKNVYPGAEPVFASTLKSSTRKSPAYPRSFGKSQQMPFPKVTGSYKRQARQEIFATTTS